MATTNTFKPRAAAFLNTPPQVDYGSYLPDGGGGGGGGGSGGSRGGGDEGTGRKGGYREAMT